MHKELICWLVVLSTLGVGCDYANQSDVAPAVRLDPDTEPSKKVSFVKIADRSDRRSSTKDWPQWRGPQRTDVSNETGLLRQWPESGEGPKQLWVSRDAGIGYSGPAIVEDILYTMGALPLSAAGLDAEGSEEAVAAAKEYLLAIDARTGKKTWAAEVGEVFQNRWGNGPRCTPTVDGDFVYALGGLGDLVCVDRTDGKVLWRRSFTEDFGGEVPNWGYCESVLIDGDRLICTPGGADGAMAALDKRTGEVIWRSPEFTDGAQYASIIAIENGGKRQYVQLTQQHLVGIDAKNGETLWSIDWPGRVAVIPTPIFHNHSVYATSGYGVGCQRVLLDAENKAEGVYDPRNKKNMKNHHGGVILFEDHVYGHSDNVGWLCQNFEDGKKVWSEKGDLGKGAIAYADNRFYCIGEDDGRVVLIEASPKGWNPKGEFTLSPQTELRKPAGRVWTHPVIVDGRLYLRDQEMLYCYDVRE